MPLTPGGEFGIDGEGDEDAHFYRLRMPGFLTKAPV
jgi:hypothetical protein